MKQFKLKSRVISQDSPAYIIAEMSANHAGSLENALELVRVAKRCGADCIKTQTYTADTITLNCHDEQFKVGGGSLWKGYYLHDLYKEAYTPWEWHKPIQEEAKRLGLDFFSTPFDFTSVDFLEELGVDFYKIASYELVDTALVKYIARTGKPIIMSTGMATFEEITEAVETIRETGNHQLALLKCSSMYPAVADHMNLITIPDLSERFDVISGLSDHSFGSFSSIVGVALGAKIIEKHLCLGRNIFPNPDSGFSMEPEEFEKMVQEVRNTEKAIGKVPYTYVKQETDSRASRRSLYVSADVKKGEVFTPNNVRSVRPADGLHTRYYGEILGKCAAQDVAFGTPLRWELVDKD
ncbi:N-acetylneuraminic acid synthase [Clostridia bacterium]|nr:N-acetylneuraminic acid synthase [Clostridia bacterium]